MSLRGSRKLVFWLLAAWLVGGPGMQGCAETSAGGTEERTPERTREGISDGGSARVLARVRAYLAEHGFSAPGLTSGGVETHIQAEDLVVASLPPSGAEVLVSGGRWDALRGEYLFYLRCRNPRECRPFLASLHIRNKEMSATLPGIASGGSASGSSARAGISEGLSRAPRSTPEGPPLVRAGERVRLRLAGSGVRIRLEAICLEAGGLGQQVRARGVGQAWVFRARVEGPRQLAMEFE